MLNSKAECAVALGAEVIRLRQALRKAEEELNRLVGGSEHPSPAAEPHNEPPQFAVKEGSVADRILRTLAGEPRGEMSAKDLAKKIGAGNLRSFRSTVFRLTDKKILKKVRRGRYRLAVAREPEVQASLVG